VLVLTKKQNREKKMRKLVVVLFSLLLVTSAFADFTWTQLNLYQGVNMAHGWADTYNDMYFEVEGGGRTGVLDFYYFFDVNTFMGMGDDPQGKEAPPG
jgi:nucleoside-specific outer membrane channel protein Tsx